MNSMQVVKKKDAVLVEMPISGENPDVYYLLISDIHWDNPHCDMGLLKRHLDLAIERGLPPKATGGMWLKANYHRLSDAKQVISLTGEMA